MKNKIEEGTVAGDIGSVTTGGTAPMKKIGAEAPLRRKNPLKKQEKKMKSFREYIIDEATREELLKNRGIEAAASSRPEYVITFDGDEEYFRSFSDKAINNRIKSKKFLKDSEGKKAALFMYTPSGKLIELDIEDFKF